MGFENTAGLGVSNFYGPRPAGGTKGVVGTKGVRNEFEVDLTSVGRPGDTFPVGNGIVVTECDLTYASATAAPTGVTSVGSATGGTLGAATYYYKVTVFINGVETLASAEANTGALSGSTNSVTVNWTAPAGNITAIRIYRGVGAGAETGYIQIAPGVTSYVDTGAVALTVVAPPTAVAITIGGVSITGATESAPVSIPEGNTGIVLVVGYSGRLIFFFKNVSGDQTHNY